MKLTVAKQEDRDALCVILARNGYTPTAQIHLTGKLGDIDNDNLLTLADLKALMRAYLSGQPLTPEQLPAYDINGDGRFTASDISAMIALF